MRGLNLVILGGNVGNHPEMKYTPNGMQIASFSLALSEKWKKKDGGEDSRLEWVRIVCFSNLAEHCSAYVGKGDAVLVVGRIRSREFEDKDQNRKKVTEVIADKIHFLTKKKRENDGAEYNIGGPDDDDVPF